MRGCFITGTGTGVGKTVLAAAIVAALRASGVAVTALKPIVTGLDQGHDQTEGDWPPDHELLARVAGCAPEQVALIGYGPAVSPHLAAELAGEPIDPAALEALIRSAAGAGDSAAGGRRVVVIEGVGGILVPLAGRYGVRELAAKLALPLVIAASPGLGTINHTLLTLEAARSAGLQIAGVVLLPWPADPGPVERSNRETIERLGAVAVATLPFIARADPELLAAAAQSLPLERWLATDSGPRR